MHMLHLFKVVVERIEEVEQQFLGVLLGVVVELGEDGAQHRPGLHRSTAGATSQPHLLQQAAEHHSDPALGPAQDRGLTTDSHESESESVVEGGLT